MKKFIFLIIFFLIGCSLTEIPVIIQDGSFSSSYLTSIETGYIPSLFNPRINDYHIGEDGYLHIDVYHEDWSFDVYRMDISTLEIEQFFGYEKTSPIEDAFVQYQTEEYTIYQKNGDESSPLEYYFVNHKEIKLFFSDSQIPDTIENKSLFYPYYDKYNGTIYLAYPEDGQCIIYELQNSGELKELNRIDLQYGDLTLTHFDARTMTFVYSNSSTREIHSGSHIYELKSHDKFDIAGSYLLIIPYRVDEDARIIHLNNYKERTLDKSVLPYQNGNYPDWISEGSQISFVEYSIPHKQYIHALYDGHNMTITPLNLDDKQRVIQLGIHTVLHIVNQTEEEHLYQISIK